MITNPVKAIREKCRQCCCDMVSEIANCEITSCALHPFRMGKNPYRSKREYTDEERKALAERLEKARKNK